MMRKQKKKKKKKKRKMENAQRKETATEVMRGDGYFAVGNLVGVAVNEQIVVGEATAGGRVEEDLPHVLPHADFDAPVVVVRIVARAFEAMRRHVVEHHQQQPVGERVEALEVPREKERL